MLVLSYVIFIRSLYGLFGDDEHILACIPVIPSAGTVEDASNFVLLVPERLIGIALGVYHVKVAECRKLIDH